MEKPSQKIDYSAIEKEFSRAFEKSLNALGASSRDLSWFCTIEEENAKKVKKAA